MATSSHWKEVQRLFHATRRLSPERQREYLDRKLPEGSPLKRKVAKLLRNHSSQDRFLEFTEHPLLHRTTRVPKAKSAGSEREPLQPGARVGAFRLLRPVGRGGMGTVWFGERVDRPFKQRVAIKLMHPRLAANPQLRRRFERERETLARLEHPNIVRLIDGGTTADDRPYLIMEYVAGRPIHHYCQERRLDRAQRITLMSRVCRAVHAAHRNRIVHRDLKPGNILVDASGEPKLLDFGICHALGNQHRHRHRQRHRSPTRRSTAAPLTLGYASPEQLRREVGTVASDTYSLGIVLLEILNSEIGTKSSNPPVRLPPEVTSILARATATEPDERYSTALELAEDLDRYLSHQPVDAHSGPVFYPLHKWAQRNRALAMVTVGAVLSLVLGTTGTVQGWRHARAERIESMDAKRLLIHKITKETGPPPVAEQDRATPPPIEAPATRLVSEAIGPPLIATAIPDPTVRAHDTGDSPPLDVADLETAEIRFDERTHPEIVPREGVPQETRSTNLGLDELRVDGIRFTDGDLTGGAFFLWSATNPEEMEIAEAVTGRLKGEVLEICRQILSDLTPERRLPTGQTDRSSTSRED